MIVGALENFYNRGIHERPVEVSNVDKCKKEYAKGLEEGYNKGYFKGGRLGYRQGHNVG